MSTNDTVPADTVSDLLDTLTNQEWRDQIAQDDKAAVAQAAARVFLAAKAEAEAAKAQLDEVKKIVVAAVDAAGLPDRQVIVGDKRVVVENRYSREVNLATLADLGVDVEAVSVRKPDLKAIDALLKLKDERLPFAAYSAATTITPRDEVRDYPNPKK